MLVVCFAMDDIRRKLELIDRQLTGPNFHERVISTCPLVFVAVGLIAGILIQNTSALPAYFWLILLTAAAVATVLFFVMLRFSWSVNYITAYLALACFVCLGAIRLTGYYQPEPNDVRNLVTNEPKLAMIRGSVITEPYISRYPDWEFARFKPSDPTSSFYLRITEVEGASGWAKVAGTVRVQVGEPVLDLQPGDIIQAYCWLDGFGPPTNPGQFDVAGYLARRNVFVGVNIESRDGIELLQSSFVTGAFARLRNRIRQGAAIALLGDLPQEQTSRGLLQALLLGYRRNIDSDTYRAFRKTGLLHFISLSGMHLGILFGIIWWLCKTMGFMKPARAVISAVAVAVFLMVVPPRAPTLRAAIICWMFCASVFFRRYPNSVNTLSLAAIVLLLIRPTQLFEAGWQLSFAAVLGIVLLADRIHFFIYERITNLSRVRTAFRAKQLIRTISGVGTYILRLFSMGLAAWLGGAGILLYHFYTINPLASIWTVLVFPLVSAILILGFLKMLLFFLLPTLSWILGIAATFLSDALIWVVKLISHLDISQILTGHVSLVPVVLYYGIIIFAAYAYFHQPMIKRTMCALALSSIVIYLGTLKWQRTHRENLVLTCLDVGHGQAILAQLPGTANVLFDAGSLYGNDIGTRIVSPYLDYIGIRKLDAVLISHNDTDHINGIPEVVENCNVRNVYANNAFFDKKDVWGTAQFLNDYLAENSLEIKRIEKNLNLGSKTKIETLWPDEQYGHYENLSDNDRSLVSLIEFAGTKILLCSDIEQLAQKELLQLYPDLKADVVVVPHHGSTTTLDFEFLKHLDANILICSCGRKQYEKKDSDSMKYFPAGARLLYTPDTGAATISVGKHGVTEVRFFVK